MDSKKYSNSKGEESRFETVSERILEKDWCYGVSDDSSKDRSWVV